MRLLLPALALLTACNGTPMVPEFSRKAIIGGVLDTDDPNVVLVVAMDKSSWAGGMCTGEIVSPHVVLTAAHCVDTRELGGDDITFYIYAGNDISKAHSMSSFLPVKETKYHPKWNPDKIESGADIGVVITKNPLTPEPLPMFRKPLLPEHKGQDLRIVGYGVTSGTDTSGQTSGVKRETTVTLEDFDERLLWFGDSRNNTCQGDSGGPALLKVKDTEYIVGVTSFGDQYCRAGGWDTRVDAYVDWVDWFIDQNDPRKEVGEVCAKRSDCKTDLCANTGRGIVCTQECDATLPAAEDTCPEGMRCADVDGESLCAPKPPTKSGGCSTAPGSASGGAGLALLALLVLPLWRRRRAS